VFSVFKMTIETGWSASKNYCTTKHASAAFSWSPAEASDFAAIVSKLFVLKMAQNRFSAWRSGAGRDGPATRSRY
jgi:hypothetical protein